MFTLVVLWRDVVLRGVDYVCTRGTWGKPRVSFWWENLRGAILVEKCEVANAMGSSGPTPLRGSIPRLLGAPGGAPAGPGPARAQSYQGVRAIAQLSPLQVRWT